MKEWHGRHDVRRAARWAHTGSRTTAPAGHRSISFLLAQSATLGGTGAAMDQRTPFGHLALAADIRSDRDENRAGILSYKTPVSASNISLARQPIYPNQPLMRTLACSAR